MEHTRQHEPPTAPGAAAVSVRGLSHGYGGPAGEVLDGVDLTVAPGEWVVLTGPSGAGKTTLLHFLAGIAVPREGEIEIAERRLTGLGPGERAKLRGRAVALVPQSSWLLPHLTVADNVALPLLLAGRTSAADARRRAEDELDALGCRALAGQTSAELSAGERARVALARALVTGAPVLLADEPTGNLDAVSRERILGRLERAAREEGRTLLVASHDEAAVARADRVLALERGRLRTVREHPRAPGAGLEVVPGGRTQRHALRVVRLLARGFRARLAMVAAGVALVVALLITVAGLLAGAEQAILSQVLGDLPTGFVRVQPRTVSFGFLELSLDRFRGGLLDADAVARLAALDGVERVHPQVMSSFPVTVSAEILDQGFRTDVALEGLTAEWLAPDVDPEAFAWRPDDPATPIPVVLSDSLIALYNAGFAKSHGLPRLSRESVRGLTLSGVLGDSSFARAPGPPIRRDFRIVGFSSRVSPLTMAVPFEALAHYNRLFALRLGEGEDEVARRTAWTSAVLELSDLEAAPQVERAVEEMGFALEEREGLAPRIGRAMRAVRLGATAMTALLVVLFGVLAAQLFAALLAIRRRYLDTLQVLGATRRRILALLATEVVGVTALGAIAGAGLGWLGGRWVARLLASRLHELLGIELTGLFSPPWLVLGAVVALLPLWTLLLSLPGTLGWLRRPLLARLRGA